MLLSTRTSKRNSKKMIEINQSLTNMLDIKLIYEDNLHFYLFEENRKLNSKGNLYHSNFIYHLLSTYFYHLTIISTLNINVIKFII